MPLVTELDHTMRGLGSPIALATKHYVRCSKCEATAPAYSEVNMNSEWGRGFARAEANGAGFKMVPTGERAVYDWLCPDCQAND